MVSDESLILQFQAGSRTAFEELFWRYRDPLYGFFRRRISKEQRAEDLAQDTWMAVLQNTVRYQPRALFRSDLYGIAFRVAAAERRKETRERNTYKDFVPLSESGDLEAGQRIRDSLGQLDVTDREILMLREYEQLSYAEISEVLQIRLNTVRSRLFRARLALKRLLSPETEILERGRQ